MVSEISEFERRLIPILPLLSAVWLLMLAGILLAPIQAYVARKAARANGLEISLCFGAAYSIAFFLPWFYLMAQIQGKRIPFRITFLLYATLYFVWIFVIGLYIFWAFNAIEYNYAYEERRADGEGAGMRTTIAFVAAIVACSVMLIYSLLGLLFERFSSFGEGGNKIKQMLVPTSRDALPYAVGALWIPLLFSTGFFDYMTALAIVFAAWRLLCRHGGERRVVSAEQRARVPDWREALPFAFFAYWILMFPVMWGIFAGIAPQ